jgi:hypothetical protein
MAPAPKTSPSTLKLKSIRHRQEPATVCLPQAEERHVQLSAVQEQRVPGIRSGGSSPTLRRCVVQKSRVSMAHYTHHTVVSSHLLLFRPEEIPWLVVQDTQALCFAPCIVIYHPIKHQQNAHVLCISLHAPTCFVPIRPSSGCLLLQNTLLSKCACPIYKYL